MKVLTSKPGEPTKILADKGYIGFKKDSPLQLMMPYKKHAHGTLRFREARKNYNLASVPAVVQDFLADFQPNPKSWSVVGDSEMNIILWYLKPVVLWSISTSRMG
jgi:hypothetical protein